MPANDQVHRSVLQEQLQYQADHQLALIHILYERGGVDVSRYQRYISAAEDRIGLLVMQLATAEGSIPLPEKVAIDE